jgi:hypothetical protein
MNAKWTSTVAAGVILIVLSSQAMAQPRDGRGRGQGFRRGQEMGGWDQGPTKMEQMAEPNGPAARRPFGFAPRGREAWEAPGLGQPGFGRRFGRQLGLTDEQVQKIRNILQEARTRTVAAIKEVLTDEQARQFEQMCPRAGQFDRPGRGPAMQNDFAGPENGRFRPGPERGPRMGPGPRWNERPDAAVDRPARPEENRMVPPIDRQFDKIDTNRDRGPERGSRMGRGPRWNERPDAAMDQPAGPEENQMMPPIERQFDEIDTNHDGALTREEIRAFHEKMAPGRGWEQP